MHFFTKTISFVAVFSVLPAAFALTARPSVMGAVSSRMPTMTTSVSNVATSGTASASSLLKDTDCIDAYTECMKGSDVCGTDFEECTTKVLFHGKMPQCLSTLAQCSTAGINSLFGTTATTALSNVASKNSYGEVSDYTYPTDGSVLGQMIIGAAITNKYDTSTCVRRYTSCLKKDSVCGSDFELCTTDTEFKKQRVFCDSTLARCQGDGLTELFGSTSAVNTPMAGSRVRDLIKEGADLAAVNAVSTCYKVVDQCILNACATNPYKCYENGTDELARLAAAIGAGDLNAVSDEKVSASSATTKSNIAGYIKNQCADTIGSNKYCYATFIGNGKMPSNAQLRDEDNQDEIYQEAYAARMNTSMKAKISELVEKFDTRAKTKCSETITACAMRVCGGGSGAACYKEVFDDASRSINNKNTREDIKTGCAAVVNTDANCQYAAANPSGVGTYSYAYIAGDAFDTLFPEYDDTATDPIGVVASLNSSLATSYSTAAIAQMKRQCQTVATSCVRSMCGTDYANCYRNRTDVYSDLTNTGTATFDKSMNKVGGVLDYTIVLGLCLDTVKNASVCEEHLAIERNKLKNSESKTASWGAATSVRGGWIDAGGATKLDAKDEIYATDENGNNLCTSKKGAGQNTCGFVDAAGNIYDEPVIIGYDTYIQSQAASSLFKDLIYDLEKEAQAKYNAKLTQEQNMCMSLNNGGVMGNKDTGSTYMWVKLKSGKVPSNYTVSGLSANQFVASNDLYGSFCRVRVTLQSDDRDIQNAINNSTWGTAYFATGDTITCGSWIPSDALTIIAENVAQKKVDDKSAAQNRVRNWMTALGTVGGATGGLALGESIRTGDVLGGLTGLKKDSGTDDKEATRCVQYANMAKSYIGNSAASVKQNADVAITAAMKVSVDVNIITAAQTAVNALKDTYESNDNPNKETAEAAAQTALDRLMLQCQAKEKDDSSSDSSESGKKWISGVSSAALGAAGGATLYFATKDIQDGQNDKLKQDTINDWMDSVGKHISCYIGSEPAGNYGTVFSIGLD